MATLRKGLSVLETVARLAGSRGATVSELSQHLSMSKSNIYRVLATLRTAGYVDKVNGTERYKLGTSVLALSASFLDGLELRDIATPLLEDLARRTGETVYLVSLDNGEVVTIDSLEGTSPYSFRASIVGARRPAHCTAAGKAMSAYVSEDQLSVLVARGMPAYTKNTITSPEQLREELRKVRDAGFAVDNEEHIQGVRCVAAPIFDYTRRMIGGISLALLASHTSLDRLMGLGMEVRDTARRISQSMGYQQPERQE